MSKHVKVIIDHTEPTAEQASILDALLCQRELMTDPSEPVESEGSEIPSQEHLRALVYDLGRTHPKWDEKLGLISRAEWDVPPDETYVEKHINYVENTLERLVFVFWMAQTESLEDTRNTQYQLFWEDVENLAGKNHSQAEVTDCFNQNL